MSFSSTPVRTADTAYKTDHVNSLRTAGVAIEGFLGGGFMQETEFTINNSEAGPTDVTGLVLDKDDYTSAVVFAEIRRKTDSGEVVAVGKISLFYRFATSTWDLVTDLPGDETGVTLTVTAAGQVQYASDTLAGANYSGTLKFKAISFAAA